MVQTDETRKNESLSNCDYEKVGHPIPVKPTQTKSRYTKKMSLKLQALRHLRGEIIFMASCFPQL